MEMTDRRASSRSWSESSSVATTTTREEVTNWCNDEIIPVRRSSSSVGSNSSRTMGISKLKRFHIILCVLTAFSIFHLMSKGPSVIDPDDMAHVVMKNATEHVNHDKSSTTTSSEERKVSPLPTTPPTPPPSSTNEKETTTPTKNPEPTSAKSGGDEDNKSSDKGTIDGDSGVDNGDSDNEIDDKPHSESKNQTETSTIEEKIQQQEEIQNIDESENINSSEQNITDDKTYNELKNETQTDGVTSTIAPSASPTESKYSKDPTSKSSTDTTTIERSAHLPKALSDSDLSSIAQNFAEIHCDLTQVKDGAWYPSGPEDDWQQRAPYLIVAGVWNAGVQPLANALLKHPQVKSAKTDGFFLPKQFSKYITVLANEKNSIANSNNQTDRASNGNNFNVKVFAARERMYAQVYSKGMFQDKTSGNEDESPLVKGDNDGSSGKSQLVGMDVSPGLIFYAQKTAHSVLCTAPWVKVVVILRNPIDRLYRQWAYSVQKLGLKLSLEAWMAQDMKLLQSVGLIVGGDEGNKEESDKKDEAFLSEKEAWEKYQSVRNVNGAIGRSLYVFQLEEWIQAYVSAGKIPSEDIIVLTTEDIEENPEYEYAKSLQFLGLNGDPNNKNGDESVSSILGNTLSQSSDLEPMTEETRKMLKKFFRPYNKRLTELLTSNGFEGDWDTRWK